MEIVKKYLISLDLFFTKFPYEHLTFVDKAFVLVKPKCGEEFYHEISYSTRYAREMIEDAITESARERLNIPGSPMLIKRTYKSWDWHLDVFEPLYHESAVAWSLLEENTEVRLPKWLQPYVIKEVTGEVRYTEKNLALYGFPQ